MRRILSSLLTLLAVTQIQAQQQRAPKLVIFITIDQLRGDYIEYFQHTFGERGFKRLMAEGAVCHDVRFGFSNLNQASTFATLFTGAYPTVHGITGLKTYSFETAKEVSQLYDADYLGNFTRDHYSPKRLQAATIGDELKIISGGRSEIYAIAPDAEAAILSAGHAANGAFWIDNYNGRWATTTYYKGIPWYVEKYNNGNESLPTRLGTRVWQPALPADKYDALPCLSGPATFQYTFKANTAGCYPDLKTSPFGNEEVSRLFLYFLEYGALGTRPTPDFVALTFYAGNYRGISYAGNTREIQDLYHRLDKELERLIDAVEKKISLRDVLFVLTGTGHFTSEEVRPEGMRAAEGTFNTKRCLTLLNMYLMAIYGQKSWVTGYYDNQIYLNHKAIEEAKIDLAEIQARAATFLQEFSGIERVTTDMALRSGMWNEDVADLSRGTYRTGRGDLLLALNPGWVVVHDDNAKDNPKVIRTQAVPTPAIFFGSGIKPQHIYREVKAVEIAPTVTHIMRIRSPNAGNAYPIPEIR